MRTELFSKGALLRNTSYHFENIAFAEDLINPASILHDLVAIESLEYVLLACGVVLDEVHSGICALFTALDGSEVCYWTILLRCTVHLHLII